MRKNINTIKESNAILWLNLSLIGIVLPMIFYYVMIANSVTTKNYQIQTLQNKLETLTEINSSFISKKIALESPATLLEFARSFGLVKASNVLYIFENKDVAQR